MALTLQRKLELAGALSKVQPQLQRLHILPEPKKRHRLRNTILVGGAIAVTVVVAAGVLRRRGGSGDAMPDSDGDPWVGFPEMDVTDTELDGPA